MADPENESPGVRLKAVEGLAGVKFLDPDSFMGLAAEASYLALVSSGFSYLQLMFCVYFSVMTQDSCLPGKFVEVLCWKLEVPVSHITCPSI